MNRIINKRAFNQIVDSCRDEISIAAINSKNAFEQFRNNTLERRAELLETIADEVMSLGDVLLTTCQEETSLPIVRLVNERLRTCKQLQMFAKVVREGTFLNATIDLPDPAREIPNSDIRYMKIPIGPVSIFGASNFPLAFSVAGGDTAAAFAAGCSVIVKAHPAHPQTSNLVATAIQNAIKRCNLPKNIFQLLHGTGFQVGRMLVQHPAIQAVGFTGSKIGGLSLLRASQKRSIPIPIYAEMGSSNPMFILPSLFETNEEAKKFAKDLVASLTLGVGQFCTQPGIIFCLKNCFCKVMLQEMKKIIEKTPVGSMLTSVIAEEFKNKIERLKKNGLHVESKSSLTSTESIINSGVATLLTADAKKFLENDELEDEVFGPSSIVFFCENKNEFMKCASKLDGHLTVSVHGKEKDLIQNIELLNLLEQKAGRIVVNGFPTGVEVNDSMVHGGPFPSTTDLRITSVGTTSINRFLRPICYQNLPQNVLPKVLQDDNLFGIVRKINGLLTSKNVQEILKF